MTDFVGWLPMPDGGAREAALTADYNAEMIEQRARFRALRDRSIFVGNPDDVVAAHVRPGLPHIRDWTEQNFDFAGYVIGGLPPSAPERAALRRRLGVNPTGVCASSPSVGPRWASRFCNGCLTRCQSFVQQSPICTS